MGAGARVNNLVEYLYPVAPIWLRPHSSFVARCMVGVWTNTPDLEKIQRVVACGNFVRICSPPAPLKTDTIKYHMIKRPRKQTSPEPLLPGRLY